MLPHPCLFFWCEIDVASREVTEEGCALLTYHCMQTKPVHVNLQTGDIQCETQTLHHFKCAALQCMSGGSLHGLCHACKVPYVTCVARTSAE